MRRLILSGTVVLLHISSSALGQEDRAEDHARLVTAREPTVEASQGALELEIGPIRGWTERWHVAPQALVVPHGEMVRLRVLAPGDALVIWHGGPAEEVAGSCSSVTYEWATPGMYAVGLSVHHPDGAVQTGYRLVYVWDGKAAGVRLASIRGRELGSTDSVAQVSEVWPGQILTAADNPVRFTVDVDPPWASGLIEWQIDGKTIGLGQEQVISIGSVGSHQLVASLAGWESSLFVETYHVAITQDATASGLRFRAHTSPPGFEGHVIWKLERASGHAAMKRGATVDAPEQDDDPLAEISADGVELSVEADVRRPCVTCDCESGDQDCDQMTRERCGEKGGVWNPHPDISICSTALVNQVCCTHRFIGKGAKIHKHAQGKVTVDLKFTVINGQCAGQKTITLSNFIRGGNPNGVVFDPNNITQISLQSPREKKTYIVSLVIQPTATCGSFSVYSGGSGAQDGVTLTILPAQR